jgi:hypothetical protein
MKVALTTREICMLIGIPLAHIATICNITEVNKLCSSNAALTSLGYRGIINFLRWRLQPIRTEYKHAIDLNMVKSDITYATHLCTNDQIHTNQLGCAGHGGTYQAAAAVGSCGRETRGGEGGLGEKLETEPRWLGFCKGNLAVLRQSLSLAGGNPKMNINGYNTWKQEVLT